MLALPNKALHLTLCCSLVLLPQDRRSHESAAESGRYAARILLFCLASVFGASACASDQQSSVSEEEFKESVTASTTLFVCTGTVMLEVAGPSTGECIEKVRQYVPACWHSFDKLGFDYQELADRTGKDHFASFGEVFARCLEARTLLPLLRPRPNSK